MLVGLVEGPLGFDHASQSQVGCRLPCLLRVLVDTAHALVAHVENEADHLRGLSQHGPSLHYVVVVELSGGWILVELEGALHVTKVVVLVLEEPRNHICKVLLILLGACFVRSTGIALLLDDTSGVIEGATRHEALLARCSLDIKNEAVGRELLSTLDPEDVAWLGISPGNRKKPFDSPSDHQVLDRRIVDLVRDFPLTVLESEVSHAHQPEIDRERHDREGYLDLVVLLRVEDEEEQDDGQDVLEVEGRVDDEVPHAEAALVPIGVDLV